MRGTKTLRTAASLPARLGRGAPPAALALTLRAAVLTALPLAAAATQGPVPDGAEAGRQDSEPVVPAAIAGDRYALDLVEVLAEEGGATYALERGPDGMEVTAAGALTWSPGADELGDHRVEVSLRRGSEVLRTASFFATVTEPDSVHTRVRTLRYPALDADAARTFRVAILMINTLGDGARDDDRTRRLEFYAPETLGHLYFHHPRGSHAFLREASYGDVALEGTVVGWLNAPAEGLSSEDILEDKGDYFALAAPHIDLSAFDVFVVHALVDGRGQQTGWLYPQQSVDTPAGRVSGVGLIWMVNSAVFDRAPLERSYWSSGDAVLPSTSWAHEFLHTLGINGHANSLDCGDLALDVEAAGNPIKGYGDVFSIMGEHAFGTHPDVLMKRRLGWLGAAEVPTIEESGIHEVHPLARAVEEVKGLVVPLDPPLRLASGVQFDALAVEYRRPIGFDRYLARLEGSPFLRDYKPEGDVDSRGVVLRLRYANPDTDGTVLLDMNPATSFAKRGIKWPGNAGKFADAILPLGRTFTIEGRVSVTPLSLTDEGGIRVRVDMDR